MFRIRSFLKRYSSEVLFHFECPRRVGSFNSTEKGVGRGIVGAPACGDVMKLEIKVNDGKIVDTRFKTFGCGSAIASSSYVAENLIGKTLEEALLIRNRDIAAYLKLPPIKLHCSMLAESAITKAIEDYRTNSK